jgi:hypothetical protein
MMHLPKYTEPNPSVEWLRDEQLRLQKQADIMMSETRIMDVFKKYGEFSGIGGSYEYGVLMYPDLDIGVVAEEASRQHFANLIADIARNKYVRGISTADTVNFNVSRHPRPAGYWIGVDIPFGDDRWGIDCWLQQPDWVTGNEDKYKQAMQESDQPAKDAILAIKYDLIRRKIYGKKYLSNDVYDAVLDKGVRNMDDFEKSMA